MDILVGFRFHPTDEEIIFLLQEKRREPDFSLPAISETNIYEFEPPELSLLSQIHSDEKWCSFFCAPNYINTDTKRVTRATKTGYWKVTGENRKIKAKRSNEEIGSKRILVFYERHSGSEIKTNWVMHQFSAKDDPLYKKDFVVCRVKRKQDKKRRNSIIVGGQQQKKLRISTGGEGQPSHHMAFESGNPVAQNTSLEIRLLLSSNCLLSNTDVAEYTSPEWQLSIAENTSPESQLPLAENISPELQLPLAENISPESQLNSQILPSNCSDSNPGDDIVAENILDVDAHHLANSNALSDCNGLDQSSFSLSGSPINLDQGSSYSSVSNNHYDLLLSPFGHEWEDNFMNFMNPQGFVWDEYLFPMTTTQQSQLQDFVV